MQQYILELRAYEDRLRILSEEIDRLSALNRDLQNEINSWKNRYYDEHQLAKKIEDY
jgi:hypothetical protein